AAGIVRAAHDLSEGGLAAAVSEMAFAGTIGAKIQLSKEMAANAEAANDITLLFAESNARLILEIAEGKEEELRSIFTGLTCTKIGEVCEGSDLVITGINGACVLNENIEELRTTWKQPLYAALGEEVPALV